MQAQSALQLEHQNRMRAWERTTPWHRRFSMRIGLEAKLVLCFMAVLTLVMALACGLFIREMGRRLEDVMGEQARQVASTLALGVGDSLSEGRHEELLLTAENLVKSRNVAFVAFLDSSGEPILFLSREPDFRPGPEFAAMGGAETLMQVRRGSARVLGDYLQVTAPVLRVLHRSQRDSASDTSRLLGYVTVGVSQGREEAQLRRVNYLVVGIACVLLIGGLPLALALVHRVFQPIRQLVHVTQQITAGNLDARTEIHRPDVIGDLSRCFDEMVGRVKQQRDALAEANRDLEQKVEQRTAQLETANNRLSAEIAEKEQFLRAVSHDLNAPLRNISGMTMMLLAKCRDKFDEDVIHRLERIRKNVEVETDLIGELLELSRIKTRRQKMERVDAEAVVGELREVFESDLRSKSIELIVDTKLPVLTAERARIRQIFQNLIDNAIKYMGAGPTGQIHVGCEWRAGEVEFYVRDTGVGIEPEDIDNVFLVFRRGRNSATQSVAGKGVGLASVKSIVETYNGRIWVHSEVGRGSTFRFTINGKFVVPAAATSPAAQPDAAAAA